MRPERYHTDDLIRVLKRRTIATMDDLKQALGTRADATVFRKLAELAYRTSYSHRGRYYTLDELTRFDELGLWGFRSVYFSVHGTLVATVEALVASSQAGYRTGELEALVNVEVTGALRKLIVERRLARTKVAGRWLYLSASPATRKAQLAARAISDTHPTQLATATSVAVLPDELKAAIVLFHSLLDERQRRLYAGLEAIKLGHGGDTQIADLLGMDVGTVATGRRQLLAGDVETDRIRRTGGGRKPAQKKRRN